MNDKAVNDKSVRTLLIANRGEIAVRIISTARKMGIRTVAIFSEADRHALHVQSADTSVFIGDGNVANTYLDKTKILNAMKQASADALHPGYGFLSEDAEFAEQVETSGFIWVGPPPAAMRQMASKAAAKNTLEPKGVPMIPGYHGDAQDDVTLIEQSKSIGYPLLVKASAGGGGKGMRVVTQESELNDGIDAARREAKSAFGDDRLLLEKFLLKPRHVEVQIMADQHGNVVSFFERDCSLQRRHQKVVEEAPAPNLNDKTRKAMWLAAETTAKEIGYVGAGTVEFILAATGEFYFLEMNTRLQVEHPITELISNVDLVEWQLRVAQGEVLDVEKPEQPLGHAMEVRLYAENPDQDFMPTTGVIEKLEIPNGDGIRFDTGVREGDSVSVYFDPMLAKLIVHGKNRQDTLQKLQRVLAETRVLGMTTNLSFLRQLVAQPAFYSMDIHTRWIDDNVETWQQDSLKSVALWGALANVIRNVDSANTKTNPWQKHSGWRMSGQSNWQFSISENEKINVTNDRGAWTLNCENQSIQLSHVQWNALSKQSGRMHAEVEGMSIDWDVFFGGDILWLDNGDRIESVQWWEAEKAHDVEEAGTGTALAVMPGTITAVHAEVGQNVVVGDKLISVEAMKMETTLVADVDGVVEKLSWQTGDQVAEGDVLFQIAVAETEPEVQSAFESEQESAE